MTGMDPLADAAALVADRFPDARWALLAGSVLDESARTPGSDLDIVVCLRDGVGLRRRESVRWRDWPVELFANTEAGHRWFLGQEIPQRKPTLARMIATGVHVAGSDMMALRVVQDECRALLDAGPGATAATVLEDARYGVTDLLDDLTHARDPGEATVVRALLWERTGHLALAAAGRWDGGGKWLVRELRTWNPDYTRRWLKARNDDTALGAVVRETLDAAGGPLFEGYSRDAPPVDQPPRH